MPIKFTSNNRVLNANARAVDPAKQTIHKVLAVQTRKYHEAFRVQGVKACLYHPLTSGVPCACKNRSGSAGSLLDERGRASTGLINELLTGEGFSITPYGVGPSNMRRGSDDDDSDYITNSTLERTNSRFPDEDTGSTAGTADDVGRTDRPYGSLENPFVSNPDDPRGNTIVPLRTSEDSFVGTSSSHDSATEIDELLFEYEDPNALADLKRQPVDADDDDIYTTELVERQPSITTTLETSSGIELGGYTDIACPICFGTGWVGGYSLHNGFRLVKSVMDGLEFNEGAYADFNTHDSPGVAECSTLTFSTVLPPAISVDAFRVFSGVRIIPAKLFVDDVQITAEYELLRYCDGREHDIEATFTEPVFFTHIEIQLNQSREWALFELPRVTRSGNQTVLDDTDPFSINVSPMIPYVAARSLIVESTYGKALLVRSTNSWNDRNRSILGWDCEVRVVQPAEMWSLLPKRLAQSPTRPAMVRDNSFGHRRT